MKISFKLPVLALVCSVLLACNQPAEESASAENTGSDAANNGMIRKLPECAQRKKDGTYKSPGGCSAEQWVEWQKKQDALEAAKK